MFLIGLLTYSPKDLPCRCTGIYSGAMVMWFSKLFLISIISGINQSAMFLIGLLTYSPKDFSCRCTGIYSGAMVMWFSKLFLISIIPAQLIGHILRVFENA
jgi:uncharacterized membrane protein